MHFRAAAGSGDGLTDRKSYQLPPGAAGLAVRTAVSTVYAKTPLLTDL